MNGKLVGSLLALGLVLSSAYGQQQQLLQQQQPDQNYQPEPEPYSFSYSAESNGGLSTHQESGDGTGRVTGFYTIQGEDGRERRVDYVADENGYRASVKTNEVGTRSQSSADALYETQLPSAKQLEAAKISYEQYKYLEDTHQVERERASARISTSGHKKQHQSESQNLNQQQRFSTTAGQQQFIDTSVNTPPQGQQFFSGQQAAQRRREQATNWQVSSQSQQPQQQQQQQALNRFSSESNAAQFNQQSNGLASSSQEVSPSTLAPAVDDSLDWRQAKGVLNQTTSTILTGGQQVQNNGYLNQQAGQTESKIQIGQEPTQGQTPQWLQIQMSRQDRPASTTVLQKQLEQQFMLQATQLTNQDYPRQTPQPVASTYQKSYEQRLSQERPTIPTWNANQKLLEGPYQQQIEQSKPFNQQQQQINIINELSEQPENQVVVENQDGQFIQQQQQQQRQQQVVNQQQQPVVSQPALQQSFAFSNSTTERVPQGLLAINLNEQNQGQLLERPTERPQVSVDVQTERVELLAGKPLVSSVDIQQVRQQSQEGGSEEVSVMSGEQDEMDEQSPVQQVNNQQQDTPSTAPVSFVPSSTSTSTTTTPTTISSNKAQEAEQIKRQQQVVVVAEDTNRQIRPNSIKQIIENANRQPAAVTLTTQQQAAAGITGLTKGSAQVIVDNQLQQQQQQQQLGDVQQPARFTGTIVRPSSTALPRPLVVEATTLASFIRPEIPSVPSTTPRPAYVTSSVELATSGWRPLPQVQGTKGSGLADLRRVQPKKTLNATFTAPIAPVAPQEPTTRLPTIQVKAVESVYTTTRPQVIKQGGSYQQIAYNQTSDAAYQPAPRVPEVPAPQWKGVKGGAASRSKQRQFWNSKQQPVASVNESSAFARQSSGANYQASNNPQRQPAKSLPGSRAPQQTELGDSSGGFGYRVSSQSQQ